MVLQLHGSTVFTWCFSGIIQYGYRQTDIATTRGPIGPKNPRYLVFGFWFILTIHDITALLTSWPWLGPRADHGTGGWGWCRAPGCTGWCWGPWPPSERSVRAVWPSAPGDHWPPGALGLASPGAPWARSTRGRGLGLRERRWPGWGAAPHWDTGDWRALSWNIVIISHLDIWWHVGQWWSAWACVPHAAIDDGGASAAGPSLKMHQIWAERETQIHN